ncbi:nucleotidyltransferase family protein [bacterium]|nr:nucleotidyltransferase family protein [bacterium]
MIFYEEIFKAFLKEKVKFVLVGGIAANLLGLMRNTADLDILVEMSDGNIEKIIKILKRRGYKVKQPVDPMGIANAEIREDWIRQKHLKAFNFFKEDGFEEVDIIIESPVSYQDAKKNAVRIKIDKHVLPVISIDNLIKMKEKTGRSVDQLDVKGLKKIKKLRNKKI